MSKKTEPLPPPKKILHMRASELLEIAKHANVTSSTDVHRMIAEIFRLRAKLRYLKAGRTKVSVGEFEVSIPGMDPDKIAELFQRDISAELIKRSGERLPRVEVCPDSLIPSGSSGATAFILKEEQRDTLLVSLAPNGRLGLSVHDADEHGIVLRGSPSCHAWKLSYGSYFIPAGQTHNIGAGPEGALIAMWLQPPSALEAQPPIPPADPDILPDDPPDEP